MLVIDEYIAVAVLGGAWPVGLPDDDLAFAGVSALAAPAAGPRSRHRSTLPTPGSPAGRRPAAGLVHGHRLFFGLERNVGRSLAAVADELGIDIQVIS